MGFDNECIQNIQSLAGEYFCPVCRLLVYPDEALYTQCTHLYCKPCLAYVVSTTRTCPYDGYLVAEAEAKPLSEANKALAETISRIAVNCLYHRSGCTWQGTLSETIAHCAGCAFGNSPVVCNRCGTQIVHRQVQEHAQICPGEQPLAQQGENPAAAADQSHSATQAGLPASQGQPSETAGAPLAAQSQNQGTPNAQTASITNVAPTPEQQWYQQQQQYYQQYYQQYPGYDPYQQQYQQYMQYQQQLQAIPGHSQPHPFIQPQQQPQPQLQTQTQPPPHPQPQPQPQLQAHPQAQAQAHAQAQTQVAAQPQTQAQIPQQLPNAHVQPHQIHPQGHAPPLVQQQQVGHPHPQGQPHLQLHSQMPQHPQLQHSQSHPHPQSQLRPQQPQMQSYPQLHVQHHPPMQPQPQPQPQPQLQPLQPQTQPHLQPQPQHPGAHAVTGHQSYLQPQPQPHQQMPSAAAQHPVHMHPQQQVAPHQMMQHPVQLQGQFPQQTVQMRPPQQPPNSHMPQQLPQQPVTLPTQGQHPQQLPQQQLAHNPGQQIPHQLSHQQPLPYQQPQFPQLQAHAPVHQPQPFPGQAHAALQQNQQSPFAPSPQVQPQHSAHPQGSLPLQQQAYSHPHLQQQSIPSAQILADHQPLNHAGRPLGPSQATIHQGLSQPSLGSSGSMLGQDIHGVSKTVQVGAGHPPSNQGVVAWAVNQKQLGSNQQSLTSHSEMHSSPLSPPSGKSAQAAASHASIKSSLSEKAQGDSLSGRAAEVPKLDVDGKYNEVASSAQLKIPKPDNNLKFLESEEKIVGGSGDNLSHSDQVVSDTTKSAMKKENDFDSLEKNGDSDQPVIKKMMEKNTSDKEDNAEAASDENVDEASKHVGKEVQDGPCHKSFSSLPGENLETQDVQKQKDAEVVQQSSAWSNERGMQSHSGANEGLQGRTLGPVLERNAHPSQNPLNVGPGHETEATHPGYHERNLSLFPRPGMVPDDRGVLSPGQIAAKGFIPPHHLAPPPDERYRQGSMPHGPSPHLQDRAPERPPAPDGMLGPPIPHPFPNYERNLHEYAGPQVQVHNPSVSHVRHPGHNAFETIPQHHHGQSSIGEEHLQAPMAKKPLGFPHSDLSPAGFPGKGMPTSFGGEPSLLGASLGFEAQSLGPPGHRQGPMPPSFPGIQRTSQGEPLTGGMMPRGPPVLEGHTSRLHPANSFESEMFGNKQPHFFEGKDAIGGMHDKTFSHGLPRERFNHFPEERYKSGFQDGLRPHGDGHLKPPFPLDSGRYVNGRREFEEDLKQFLRPAHLDGDRGSHGFVDRPSPFLSHDIGSKSDVTAVAPPGSLFPVGSGGSLNQVDPGDRLRPISFHDKLGRNTDASGAPEFLKNASDYGRHRMHALPPPTSPGREYPGLPSNRYGNSPAAHGLGVQTRSEDFDGRNSHGFGERWPGTMPASLRRSELDASGNLLKNEPIGSGRPAHLKSGDMFGSDATPINLRGNEPIGSGSLLNHVRGNEPHNLPGHFRGGEPLGPAQLHTSEPATFGGIPSHIRAGGARHLPPHLRVGDPVGGGNFPSHMRMDEPGHGSGFPIQGFPGTQGNMESFDHSRKRKPGSNGWCRICKIDCESVEGLDVHSQTREHQKMAMDIVLKIKQDNAKKHKLSSEEHLPFEDLNKQMKANCESRGTTN